MLQAPGLAQCLRHYGWMVPPSLPRVWLWLCIYLSTIGRLCFVQRKAYLSGIVLARFSFPGRSSQTSNFVDQP